MYDGGSGEPRENNYVEDGSLLTFDSTVWGPGALTGKFLKAVGEIGLDMIVEAVIRRRLSVIKKTLKKRPAVFLEIGSQDTEESQQILRDLEDMCGDDYSDSVCEVAARLKDVILVYQNVPVLRQALETKRRIFSRRRRNKRRDAEDVQLANQTFEALMELMSERSDDLGIAARRLVEAITKYYLESRARKAKRRRARALALGRDAEHIEYADIMIIKETKTVYLDEIRIGNTPEIRSSVSVRSNYNQEDDNATLVTQEKMTDNIHDVRIEQLSRPMSPDGRARSLIIEKNAMAHYLNHLNTPVRSPVLVILPVARDFWTS